MDRRTTSRGVSQVPAVLRLRVDASICATEPNTPAPHGDLDRWPEVALYCSRRGGEVGPSLLLRAGSSSEPHVRGDFSFR